MKKLLYPGMLLLSLVVTSCWYNRKWEDLHPIPAGPGPGGCSDTAGITMSYSVHIAPLIQTNCGTTSLGCHKTGSTYDLSGYAGVNAVAQSGQLLGAIRHLTGYNPMPQGASKLADCEIAKVVKWVQSGSPNN